MRIAFFIPKIPDGNCVPALGVLYIAAMLEKNGFQARVFDERITPDCFGEISRFKPDVLGLSAVTAGLNRCRTVAMEFKARFPTTRIVFGGPHPSALPLEVLREPFIDYVIKGEAEKSFTLLCEALRKNSPSNDLCKVGNLYFKEGENSGFTHEEGFLNDSELDGLPFPAFHLMEIENYFAGDSFHGLFKRGTRILPIMTTRGCPCNCTYCCRVLGKKIRMRSIPSILEEVKFLIKEYGVDELFIEDDNFTVFRDRALELLAKIAELKALPYLKFANGIRADLVDAELLKAMKKAGVYSISFGIESGSPSTLKRMKKGLDLGLVKKNVNLARSLGFLVGGNCIIGYPGETKKDVLESLDFFSALDLDSMAIVNLVPFPGTEAREICEREGYLTPLAQDWDNYYFSIHNPISLIETPWMSSRNLVTLVRKAYRKMYFRPKWQMKILRNLSLNQIIQGIRLVTGL